MRATKDEVHAWLFSRGGRVLMTCIYSTECKVRGARAARSN